VEVMSFKFPSLDNENDDFLFDYLRKHSNQVVSSIEETMKNFYLNGIVSTKLNGIQILLEFDNTIDYKKN
jgi:hypothetical protein